MGMLVPEAAAAVPHVCATRGAAVLPQLAFEYVKYFRPSLATILRVLSWKVE